MLKTNEENKKILFQTEKPKTRLLLNLLPFLVGIILIILGLIKL